MPPAKRRVRNRSGWLAIPASLILLITGCQTNQIASEPAPGITGHSHAEALVEGSPFQKIFSGDADLVVLTFFDLYCVACQQSAQNFNLLHDQMVQSFPGTRVQVTGIGIGDTAFELSVFQKKYELAYTCLPDPEKEFEQPFGVRGTPTILVFQRKQMDCVEVYRHEGRFRMDDLNQLVSILSEKITSN